MRITKATLAKFHSRIISEALRDSTWIIHYILNINLGTLTLETSHFSLSSDLAPRIVYHWVFERPPAMRCCVHYPMYRSRVEGPEDISTVTFRWDRDCGISQGESNNRYLIHRMLATLRAPKNRANTHTYTCIPLPMITDNSVDHNGPQVVIITSLN